MMEARIELHEQSSTASWDVCEQQVGDRAAVELNPGTLKKGTHALTSKPNTLLQVGIL